MTFARPSPRAEQLLLWAFVGLACIARFIHLDSDPKFEYWIFYVEDEGRWVETARNLALFGELRLYGISKLHLILSPLFQAANYAAFEIGGVSFWSARIWSAVCGAGIVIVSFVLLRRVARGFPLYLGLAVLAFEPLTLCLSRTALPEVPSLFFTLLAFTALCTWQRRIRGAVAGGLFLAIAIGMKGTTVLMAPAFLVIVALSGVSAPARVRLLRFLAFLLGLLIPAVLALALALSTGIINVDAPSGVWPVLRQSLSIGSFYTIVSRFASADSGFDNANLLLLGAWVCSWILLCRKEFRGTPLGEIYELSGIWAVGWLIAWAPLEYTPTRYVVHLILPLVIHIVAGLALWRTIGPARVLATIDLLRARRGIAFFAWLVLPAAVLAGSLMVTLAGVVGLPNDRLVYKLVAIVAIGAVLIVLARAAGPGEGAVTGFIAFSVIAALLGMTIQEVGVVALPRSAAERGLPIVKLVVLGSVAFWFWLGKPTPLVGLLATPTPLLPYVLLLGGLFLQSAPELLQPTYSIRDASRSTARMFQDAGLLQSSGAGALLLETRIPYRDAISPGTHVAGILNYDRLVRPNANYVLADVYRLVVHPRYYSSSRPRMDSGAALVEVYRAVQRPDRSADSAPSHRD